MPIATYTKIAPGNQRCAGSRPKKIVASNIGKDAGWAISQNKVHAGLYKIQKVPNDR
jgi:hypothetical protein